MDDELVQIELVLPEQANHYGTLFAANGLALLGKVAFLTGTRYSRKTMVMAAANHIEFVKPVPVGSVLRVTGRITRVGRSSLTARVVACHDADAESTELLRGDFELVAVDENGRPSALAR